MILEKTQILKVDPALENTEDFEKLKFAADIIKRGGLCVFPTETVYGLGANALNEDAVKDIFRAKGRPQDNPLIVHVADADDIEKYAITKDNVLFEKLKPYMPAPLTCVLPKKDIIPDVVSAGLSSVGMRVPENKVAREFLRLCALPVAAPSANISGRPSPTKASHVINDMMGRVDVIIDAGDCSVGVESTVVSLCENIPTVLRPGGFTKEMIENICGKVQVSDAVLNALKEGQKAESPGMKYKHYAPENKVVLVKGAKEKVREFLGEVLENKNCAVICYEGDTAEQYKDKCIFIGSREKQEDYARLLFDALRQTDKFKDIENVFAVLPQNTDGISLAVYNRMLRASAFQVIDADKL